MRKCHSERSSLSFVALRAISELPGSEPITKTTTESRIFSILKFGPYNFLKNVKVFQMVIGYKEK